MRARRTAVLLLTTGATCLAAAALPLESATADGEPGSGLGSFALSANAPVMQVREDYAQQQCGAQAAGTAGCEGVVNESVSQLTNGPIGYALASVTWPGTLAGNLGTLLVVASGGSVPSQATALNSPVRAEARTGGTNPVVTDYPGNGAPTAAHMRAEALPTSVTAEATVGSAQNAVVGSTGPSTSSTSTTLTGVSTAAAQAHSQVSDVTIAGVVHLGSVTSQAVATTTGTSSKGSGSTVVTGASIAGVPVTIDEHGVTVQTQNQPLPAQATDAVNTALANAGMTIAVSRPTITSQGPNLVATAGSVVFFWNQQPGQSMTVVLGGAQVSLRSSPGFAFGAYTPPPFSGGTAGSPATTGSAAPPPLAGAVSPPLTGQLPPPTVGGPAPSAFAPQLAASPLRLPHGLSPWLGALALLGAGLLMAGLRRLPDRVLAASPSACPLGETA